MKGKGVSKGEWEVLVLPRAGVEGCHTHSFSIWRAEGEAVVVNVNEA